MESFYYFYFLTFKKHELPLSDQIVDILAETQNQTSLNVQDRQPLFKRLTSKYFETDLCSVLEDINSLSKAALEKS